MYKVRIVHRYHNQRESSIVLNGKKIAEKFEKLNSYIRSFRI